MKWINLSEIKDLLYRNWLAKLISLIIAILLWLYVNYEKLPEKYISLHIKMLNQPKILGIAEPYKDTVTVKVKAPENILQTIYQNKFSAEVDLKNAVAGKNIFPVKVAMKKKYRRARITGVDPAEIELIMDKYIIKEVPVSTTVINTPVEGYIKISENYFPKTVPIGGPASIVNELTVVRTKPIDIDGVTADVHKQVELDLPSEFLTTRNYKRIDVSIKIKKNFVTSTIRAIKVIPKNLPDSFEIVNPDDLYVRATISGPPERLEKLEKSKDFIFVDLEDITESGTEKIKVRYKIPWSCRMLKIEPRELKIEIEKK